MEYAERIRRLPPYLFAELDRKIAEKRKEGVDVISFGVGDPDLPTPEHIVEAACEAAKKPENHRYPSYEGMLSFREAVAERYQRDFGVELDPEREVIALIGSKEGVHNIHFAFVNPGDVVLYTNPGYPVYRTGVMFAGGEPYAMPLRRENNFLPDLEEIPRDKVKRAKMMWINYPNNPTAAVAEADFYRGVIDFARDNDIIVCSDEAYSAIAFDNYRVRSFLEFEGSREVGIAIDSLSKMYNMTGWRIAYACGNSEVIAGLGKVKTNVDSGASQIIQEAAMEALRGPQECVSRNVHIYQERRDVLVDGLRKLGFNVEKPRATFYVWMPVPEGDSMSFAEKLLEVGVVVTPGVGFGEYGEGFVRFALTQPVERIQEALERIEGLF
ncbi:LL-diaminopimelate aminotransferase [Candidatus Pyrohabitans sp.]